MTWQEIVQDPQLQNLPYQIETNQSGQLMMTPAKVRHGRFQTKISSRLELLLLDKGEVTVECAIQTSEGTKVVDVAWFSSKRWELVKRAYQASVAPEICIEVYSPGNSSEEMKTKRRLYFEKGALEVWICDTRGRFKFYDANGEIIHLALVP